MPVSGSVAGAWRVGCVLLCVSTRTGAERRGLVSEDTILESINYYYYCLSCARSDMISAVRTRTTVLRAGVIWCLICSGDNCTAAGPIGWSGNARDASRACPPERNCRTINADTRERHYLIKKHARAHTHHTNALVLIVRDGIFSFVHERIE